jgi:dTMP kinase
VFITLEGPEGSGKTTQAHLLAKYLQDKGVDLILTREPGGTSIGDKIRDILHDPGNTEMFPWAEVLLYSASRAQLVAQTIRPSLAAGKVVVCDRYADSTMAYQGYGRGLDLIALREITKLATGGLTPDLTLYIDIQPEQGLQRRLSGGDEWNRLDQEALDFHHRVRSGYLELIAMAPERWVTVDGSPSVAEVHQAVRSVVDERMVRVDT